jgi:hypothetical protein
MIMASNASDLTQQDFRNQREHPRVEVDLKTDFRVLMRKPKEGRPQMDRVTSQAKTLGKGGLKFVSTMPLSVGDKIDMRLYYYSLMIEFVAEVVWMEERQGFGPSEYICGSRFAAITYDNIAHLQNIIQSFQTH